jgi:hypothetical protein
MNDGVIDPLASIVFLKNRSPVFYKLVERWSIESHSMIIDLKFIEDSGYLFVASRQQHPEAI